MYNAVPVEERQQFPLGESYAMAKERVLGYWKENIQPWFEQMQPQKQILIVGHNNVLKSIVQTLHGMTDKRSAAIEVPHARPMVIEWDRSEGKVVTSYFLDDKNDLVLDTMMEENENYDVNTYMNKYKGPSKE